MYGAFMTELVKNLLSKVPRTSELRYLNIKKHIADYYEEDQTLDQHRNAIRSYCIGLKHIYLAEDGLNTKPIFIFAEKEIMLGNRITPLKLFYDKDQMNRYFDYLDDRTIRFCAFADPILRSHLKELYATTKKSYRILISSLLGSYEAYELGKAWDFEIDGITEDEFNALIKEFVCNGYEIDENLEKIFIAGLCLCEVDTHLMKYQPHGLIIKNPKTGVSSISSRIGLNIDQASLKTLEGYADAEGNIFYSPLHNISKHVNFDEASFMPDLILQKMFSYMEQGTYKTMKGGREIQNEGCARVIFTLNPPDLERRKDGSLVDYTPYVVDRFKNIISKLSNTSSAALSRFAFVIFDTEIKAAQKKEFEGDDYYAEVNSLMLQILEKAQPIFSREKKHFEAWLNQSIPEYDKQLDLILNARDDKLMKEMWSGQKEAYRHIRGQVLSYALVKNLYWLLLYESDEEVIEEKEKETLSEVFGIESENKESKKELKMEDIRTKVITEAEEELNYIIKLNLKSLLNILEAEKRRSPESFAVTLENVKPVYLRALLYAYCNNYAIDKTYFDMSDLKRGFEEIPEDERKKEFGTFCYWARVEAKINFDKLQKTLLDLFDIELFFLDERWVLVKNNDLMNNYKEYKENKNKNI